MKHVNWSGCDLVEVVSNKVSGVPLIRGTRVPADQVIESIESGESVEEIAYNFDLRPADVRLLLEFRASRKRLTRQ